MSKEAMKLALEALEENHHLIEEHERPEYLAQYDRVISALEKALAEQPAPVQQEPFAKEHEFVQWGVSKYGPLLKAAIDLLAEVDVNLESKDVPQKFGVPFGKLNALREALAAAPQPAQQTCNCRWEGDVQVQECTLHQSHLIAVLYHASPTLLREKVYNALDEFLPDLDEGCRERGCIAVDHFKEKTE